MILLKYILPILILLSLSLAVNAEEPIYTGLFGNLALGGDDSVSYFEKDSKPVKGSKTHALEWCSAEWRIANQKNLEEFRKPPEAFAPQYGGYSRERFLRVNSLRAAPGYTPWSMESCISTITQRLKNVGIPSAIPLYNKLKSNILNWLP